MEILQLIVLVCVSADPSHISVRKSPRQHQPEQRVPAPDPEVEPDPEQRVPPRGPEVSF